VKARKLALIAVTGPKRFPALPNVPTISESGLPGYEVTSWNALFAPAGTPAAIVNRLHPIVRDALTLQEAKALAESNGLDIAPSTPAELGKLVRAELVKWAKVIKAAGIQPD
jgi:tripartite-type tricarboxylate transporter receptor subunit TctC